MLKRLMGHRRRSREIALQVLYQVDLTGMSAEEAFSGYCEQLAPPREAEEFARFLLLGVENNRRDIDRWIDSASRHWRVSRMSPVDRNILRIASFELRHCDNIPPKVSINEAVELAKRFGSADSKAFVNGVLDRLYSEQGETD